MNYKARPYLKRTNIDDDDDDGDDDAAAADDDAKMIIVYATVFIMTLSILLVWGCMHLGAYRSNPFIFSSLVAFHFKTLC